MLEAGVKSGVYHCSNAHWVCQKLRRRQSDGSVVAMDCSEHNFPVCSQFFVALS